jgi:hypothetical protein
LLFLAPALFALRGLLPGAQFKPTGRDATLLLALLWLLPVALGLSAGLLGTQYAVRYVGFAAAPYMLLVARGLDLLPWPGLRWALLSAELCFTALALHSHYTFIRYENYRDALAYMATRAREGDCSVFIPFGDVPLEWTVYYPDQPPPRVVRPAEALAGVPDCARLWVVAYRRVGSVKEEGERFTEALGRTYRKASEATDFAWLHVYRYVPRGAPD